MQQQRKGEAPVALSEYTKKKNVVCQPTCCIDAHSPRRRSLRIHPKHRLAESERLSVRQMTFTHPPPLSPGCPRPSLKLRALPPSPGLPTPRDHPATLNIYVYSRLPLLRTDVRTSSEEQPRAGIVKMQTPLVRGGAAGSSLFPRAQSMHGRACLLFFCAPAARHQKS